MVWKFLHLRRKVGAVHKARKYGLLACPFQDFSEKKGQEFEICVVKLRNMFYQNNSKKINHANRKEKKNKNKPHILYLQ